MKSALIFEKDEPSRAATLQLVRWLGYRSVAVSTPRHVLLAVKQLAFDMVILHTSIQSFDRRMLAADVKHIVPTAVVVLVTDSENEITAAAQDVNASVSIVLRRPLSLELLRRKLEYGIDGYGTQREYLGPVMARRKGDAS